MRYTLGKVRVWKDAVGVFVWECTRESCRRLPDDQWGGASIFWEIAQHYADEHAREHHIPAKRVPHDMATPPGGTHFDWSDTGMHLRVREDDLA